MHTEIYLICINTRQGYVMYKKVFLDAPNVGVQEKKYLNRAVDSCFVSAIGPVVGAIENKFATY